MNKTEKLNKMIEVLIDGLTPTEVYKLISNKMTIKAKRQMLGEMLNGLFGCGTGYPIEFMYSQSEKDTNLDYEVNE